MRATMFVEMPQVNLHHTTDDSWTVDVWDAGHRDEISLFLPSLAAVRKLASRLCQAVGQAEAERPAGGHETAQDAAKGEEATTES